ncbi:hypothetical protein AB5I41_10585 [Sphingomonas sp. MMS24-JH45]
MLGDGEPTEVSDADALPKPADTIVSQLGDMWQLGDHRVDPLVTPPRDLPGAAGRRAAPLRVRGPALQYPDRGVRQRAGEGQAQG